MKIIYQFKNKVLIYLTTRYATYIIQFFTSILIANKLGPFYMGVWGFILLILNYFGQLHFGIANSLNVLLVQHKDEPQKYNKYINNSVLLMFILSLLIGLVYVYYLAVGIPEVEAHHGRKYMGAVCLIAICQHFNGIFVNIYRVKNQLNSISLMQSLVVIIPFGVIFFFKGERLIDALVGSYLISNFACVFYAFTTRILPKPRISDIDIITQKEIFVKGIFLFLYNTSVAFIVISIRSIVSANYSLEEFGMFTFAFTLGNAVMMLMDAIAFIALPKILNLFCSKDIELVKHRLLSVRYLYMSASHLLVYLFFPVMSLLIHVMPQYKGSVTAFNIIALSLAMNKNSFGYLSLLMARNREKTIAIIAATALLLNIAIAMALVKLMCVDYNNVALATLFANLFICITTYYICCRELKMTVSLQEIFPLPLLLPYLTAVVISILNLSELLWMPVAIFSILNVPALKELLKMGMKLLKNPSIMNV